MYLILISEYYSFHNRQNTRVSMGHWCILFFYISSALCFGGTIRLHAITINSIVCKFSLNIPSSGNKDTFRKSCLQQLLAILLLMDSLNISLHFYSITHLMVFHFLQHRQPKEYLPQQMALPLSTWGQAGGWEGKSGDFFQSFP